MGEVKCTVNRKYLIFLLCMYMAGIFVWDATVVYRIILLVMMVGTFLSYKIDFFKLAFFPLCYGLLFVYFLFHTLCGFSVDSSLSYEYLATMLVNLVAIMCCVRIVDTRRSLHLVMKACVWVSFALIIYIVIVDRENIFTGILGMEAKKPFTDTVFSHNDVPQCAALSVLFLSYFRAENIKIPFNRTLSLLFSVYVLLTGARKSFILVVFGIVIYPLVFANNNYRNIKSLTKTVLKILVAVFLIAFFYYILMNNQFVYDVIGYRFEGYFSGLTDGEYEEGSAAYRDIMRQTAINLIMEKPLIGHGLNTFRTFKGSFDTWSHDNYLELWVSGGIVPVIIYYMFFIYAIVKLIKIRNDNLGSMFLALCLFWLIYDYLSVSYIIRFSGFTLSLVNAYILFQQNERRTS